MSYNYPGCQESATSGKEPPTKTVEAGLIPNLVLLLKEAFLPNLNAAWAFRADQNGYKRQRDLTMCEQSKFHDSPEFRNNIISNNAILCLCQPYFDKHTNHIFLEHHMGFVQPMPKQECLTLRGGSEADAVYTPVIMGSLSHTSWVLTYLSEGCNKHIHHVTATGVLYRLVEIRVQLGSQCLDIFEIFVLGATLPQEQANRPRWPLMLVR